MRVLIAGGAGYLGRLVVAELRKLPEITPVVYDCLLYDDVFAAPDVEFVFGDVNSPGHLAPVLAKADCVVWLAAIVGDGACANQPSCALDTNWRAVAWLAEHYAGPVIFTSTCSEYGVSAELAAEDSPFQPQSLYAETKIKAEAALAGRALILRLGTLYGLGGRPRFDLVVNTLAAKALTTGVIEVYGGQQYRPLLAVADAARFIATRAALLDWLPGVYNLAAYNLRVRDIAEMVADIAEGMGRHTAIIVTDSPYEDNRNYRVDMAAANRAFGRYATTDFILAARELMQAVCERRIKDPGDPRWNNATWLSRLNPS